MSSLWSDCLSHLQTKVSPTDYSMWLRPLQASFANGELVLYAQNRIVAGWVKDKFLTEILSLVRFLTNDPNVSVTIREGFKPEESDQITPTKAQVETSAPLRTNINPEYTFDSFVLGSSNQLAKAIAEQVANNPGGSHCNPFSLYGGTGLGKTHLLHAIGNEILQRNAKTRVVYTTAVNFMQEMVRSLNDGKIENFKKFYHSLDVLMIDDIQFLANATKTKEEFFHIFNSLFEQGKQIIVVSDVFPRNIDKLEERTRSRLSCGMSAEIQPPDLETRVAILTKKAEKKATEFEKQWGHKMDIKEDAIFFMAQKLRTNVRELEGALKQVVANAGFKRLPITVDFAREHLKDRIAAYDYLVTIENIQRTVAEYYNVKMADMKSKTRSRSIARPRQIAMALAKELTSHSLPEIGREFGGRDHTTVMHACKTINELRLNDSSLQEDYINLTRKLSS